MDDNIMKHILKMMGISEDEMQMYGSKPMFVSAIPIKKRNIKSQKSERQKILDKMAVLKELINKSLDINNKKDFEKYSKEYKELINNI